MNNLNIKLIFTSFVMCFLWSTGVESGQPAKYRTDEGCICYFIYAPICATDGKTYANDCVLKCSQRRNPYLMGVCKGECPCCKPAYHNEPPHVEIPLPTGESEGWGWSVGTGSTSDGWGWSMGSTLGRFNLGPMGMSFPFWNGGYSASPYPFNYNSANFPRRNQLVSGQVGKLKNGGTREILGSAEPFTGSYEETMVVSESSSLGDEGKVPQVQNYIQTVSSKTGHPAQVSAAGTVVTSESKPVAIQTPIVRFETLQGQMSGEGSYIHVASSNNGKITQEEVRESVPSVSASKYVAAETSQANVGTSEENGAVVVSVSTS